MQRLPFVLWRRRGGIGIVLTWQTCEGEGANCESSSTARALFGTHTEECRWGIPMIPKAQFAERILALAIQNMC